MMKDNRNILLIIDSLINLLIGLILLLFPCGVSRILGLPESNTNFYPIILGAVIFGIGVALLIERYGSSMGIRGLGLGGAIAINLIGAGILMLYLIIVPFNIPVRGYIVLWSIAVIVLFVGLIEFVMKSWKCD